jgi:opacity protein-like surface antigen
MKSPRWPAIVLGILTALGLALAPPAFSQSTEPNPPGWQFQLTPYAWLAGLTGEIQAGQASASIGASFSNILDSLDLGLMGTFAARKGRWGVLFDGIYARLSKDGTSSGAADLGVHTVVVSQIYSLALSFQALRHLEILGGVRVMPISASLEVTSGTFAGAEASGSNTAVDGFVGARLVVPLIGRLALEAYGDIGAGDSKFVWQGLAGLGLKLSKTLSAKLGYRYLSIENESPHVTTRMAEGGFCLGLGIKL